MIRVVIADDHTIVRAGIRQLLSLDNSIAIIGEACNGSEVLDYVRTHDFDVLLLDMSMPGKSGMELIKHIKIEDPKLKILVLSMHEAPQYMVRAIKSGASGYLIKEGTPEQLLSALRKVAAGGFFITPEAAEYLVVDSLKENEGPRHNLLSDREFQVFNLLASGQTVSAIAEQLHLSVKTISTHKMRLMQKMRFTNHSEIVLYALEYNLMITN